MMTTRAQRLKRLVRLQSQIKALHETKHATYLAQAAAARKDATELLDALNTASPLPGLFPDLYNKRITAAVDREEKETRRADQEATRVATATARTTIVEKAYRDAFRLEEREAAEKDQLESVERRITERK
ncbi:hypothetical protein [Mesorhizobium sp. CAU 1741]|uniref:hypothetical protein n=1 Tax=Mesorhizobium sp. CAU 1741 TaxID=3140366 RepID=UPI00325BD15D